MAPEGSVLAVFELLVEVSVLVRNLRVSQRCDLPLRKLTCCDDPPIAALEPGVFLGGNQNRSLLASLRNGDGLCRRDVLVRADVAMKLSRRNCYRIICSPNTRVLDYTYSMQITD
jgi:hypothetical protein